VVAVALAIEKVVDGVVMEVVTSGEVIDWTPVKVCAASVRATEAEVVGKVIVVASVPASVMELLAVKVLPSAMVRVEPVAGAVSATLFTLVAEATPSVGVVSEGEVARTIDPEPVVVLPRTVTVPVTSGKVAVLSEPVAAEATVNLIPVALPDGSKRNSLVSSVESSTDTLPVPLALRCMAMFASSPAVWKWTPSAALLTISKWFTAAAVVSKTNISLPFASAMNPPSANLGAVRVLFVRVSDPARVATVPEAEGPVSVTPSGIVRVAEVAGWVIVTLPTLLREPWTLSKVTFLDAGVPPGSSVMSIKSSVETDVAAVKPERAESAIF
jgi:hypothetical protein